MMGPGMMSPGHYKMELDMFNSFDKNHDGSLTRDELSSSSSIVSQFSTYDTNGDGKLSETEYTAASGNPSSPR